MKRGLNRWPEEEQSKLSQRRQVGQEVAVSAQLFLAGLRNGVGTPLKATLLLCAVAGGGECGHSSHPGHCCHSPRGLAMGSDSRGVHGRVWGPLYPLPRLFDGLCLDCDTERWTRMTPGWRLRGRG
jgi:hypothetical protein